MKICLYKQVSQLRPMLIGSPKVFAMSDEQVTHPLTTDEEAAWRALARVAIVLPRLMDAELLRQENLTLTEYTVLMVLSEAPHRSLRMTELADRVPITVSGLTRLVERLTRQGMVERTKAPGDGRGQAAVLTDAGLERLRGAWPAHLESVRRVVLANLGNLPLTEFARALEAIAAEETGHGSARRRTLR
jgi:DNA-binding MarR family transcriptional regulator